MTKLFLIVLFAVFALFPKPVEAKSFFFPSVVINAQINKDTSVNFEEKRTFDFDGSFTQIYWDIPVTGNQQISDVSIEEVGVGPYEEIGFVDPGRPSQKFAVERQGDSYHIEAWHNSSNEQKDFLLKYKVTGAVQKYQD